MAKVTNLTLRHKVVYYLYIRNFTEEGTFRAVIPELERLRDLGIDIIVLQSIFPTTDIVQEPYQHGNPFVVKDFDQVNPEYGTPGDFRDLVDAIHDLGMQVVINLPLFHLAKDSKLVTEQPDFFLKDDDGNFVSRISLFDSSYDLNYNNPKLWDYLIERLEYWATLVDGFSTNHAQLIRPEFWSSARAEVEDVHPYFYWIAGIMPDVFMQNVRIIGMPYLTYHELSSFFDLIDNGAYMTWLERFYSGKVSLENFAYFLNWSELNSPTTLVRLQALEYTYSERLAKRCHDVTMLANWTAFSFFQKGTASLVMGQEYGSEEAVNYLSDDVIDWTVKHDLTPLIHQMAQIKKREECKNGYYFIEAYDQDVLKCSYHYYDRHLIGAFKLRPNSTPSEVQTNIPDGTYTNLLTEDTFTIKDGKFLMADTPIIIAYQGKLPVPTLMDKGETYV
ncbi:alpha-amylase family glycosyl hydrolase [Aerococcus suis]|uniref:Alpha amylase, catalytic domain n=1 Tax=Aerococcus suis TaxID=371602 RepID=A0A1W1Z568_9LACT|nr:alpha-amylase family glycosyl hydrolase [Aerococcus suis]MCI7240039.1 alpha-amylase family glycosyl hydrolase [Aerococcus suis]MDY4646748.1 alpha-amylase family glycosyl hydrolase [Aerococcus suis]SMC43569.1 Alpha amylase, catalytic domain [Aerococcus suis]